MPAAKPGAPRKFEEHYPDCSSCFHGRPEREYQVRLRCVVLPPSQWAPCGTAGTAYMGDAAHEYGEDDTDGCPGGWYRAPFVASLDRYRGTKDRESPYLRQCTDRLVWEALQYLETEQARFAESLT